MQLSFNTVDELLRAYVRELAPWHGADEARAMARVVFQERLGWDAAQLEERRPTGLSESELLLVYLPLKRLRKGEPLQYVLGSTRFHGLQIAVDPAVLIPRPETEEMVDLIVRSGGTPRTIVDLGTGSGCIALALKEHFPDAQVIGIDLSMEALAVARRNGKANGLEVEWRHDDLLSMPFPDADLIVGNPPYIPAADAATLARHVREHEPHLALFVEGGDPLRFHRRIGKAAKSALREGGALWLEAEHRRAHEAGDVLRAMGWSRVDVLNDLSGSPRFIKAQGEA